MGSAATTYSLRDVQERWDPRQHALHRRLVKGTLTAKDVRSYLEQYRHGAAVLTDRTALIADLAPDSMDADVEAMVADSEEQATLWGELVEAAGGRSKARALPETKACAAAWRAEGMSSLARLSVGLYVIRYADAARWHDSRRALGADVLASCGIETIFAELIDQYRRDIRVLREILQSPEASAGRRALHDEAQTVLAAGWGLLDGVLGSLE